MSKLKSKIDKQNLTYKRTNLDTSLEKEENQLYLRSPKVLNPPQPQKYQIWPKPRLSLCTEKS